MLWGDLSGDPKEENVRNGGCRLHCAASRVRKPTAWRETMNVKESWVGSQRSLMLWLSCWALSRDQKGDVKGVVEDGNAQSLGCGPVPGDL